MICCGPRYPVYIESSWALLWDFLGRVHKSLVDFPSFHIYSSHTQLPHCSVVLRFTSVYSSLFLHSLTIVLLFMEFGVSIIFYILNKGLGSQVDDWRGSLQQEGVLFFSPLSFLIFFPWKSFDFITSAIYSLACNSASEPVYCRSYLCIVSSLLLFTFLSGHFFGAREDAQGSEATLFSFFIATSGGSLVV